MFKSFLISVAACQCEVLMLCQYWAIITGVNMRYVDYVVVCIVYPCYIYP